MHAGKKNRLVHRLAYEVFRDCTEIAGKQIHHTCGNKWCANPWHMEVVTQSEHVEAHKAQGTYGHRPKAIKLGQMRPDTPYLRRRAKMTHEQIVALNARAAELARERRRRNPEKIRAQARAKCARQKERKRRAQAQAENPGVEVELVL